MSKKEIKEKSEARVGCRLPKSYMVKLKKLAEKYNTSFGELIRIAIKECYIFGNTQKRWKL